MRRTHLGVAALAALLLGAPASASAGTLDQQQTDGSGSGNSMQANPMAESNAQTFTARISGKLDQVDLFLRTFNGTPPDPVTVEIRDSSGTPGNMVRASHRVPVTDVSSVAGFVPVRFDSPAPVTAGTQYTIVAYTASPGPFGPAYVWQGSSTSNPYPDGAAFSTTTSPPSAPWSAGFGDFAFKAYVNPSNSFSVGAITRNKKKGTATINLTLPNPGELAGSGNGAQVASAGRAVTSKSVGAGQAHLLIKATGKKKRKLNETGKVKLSVAITYTPAGGDPAS